MFFWSSERQQKEQNMSVRVLSTEQGKTAITRVSSILNGGLADQIRALKAEGQTLSDPNIWDGLLAEDFRSNTWPGAASNMDAVTASLEELQRTVASINADIMVAGGNN
jgi:uncharacterized protein YukE